MALRKLSMAPHLAAEKHKYIAIHAELSIQ